MKMQSEAIIDAAADAITTHSEPKAILLFGSRVGGFANEQSDFDIAVDDDSATDRQMRKIRDAVDEIRTLHRIEVVWLHRISDDFKNEIFRTAKVIYARQEQAAVRG